MRVRSIAAARSYVDSLQEGIEARKTNDNTRVCKHTILVATRTLAVIVFIFDLFDPLTTFISHRPRMVPLSFFLSYNSSVTNAQHVVVRRTKRSWLHGRWAYGGRLN